MQIDIKRDENNLIYVVVNGVMVTKGHKMYHSAIKKLHKYLVGQNK